MLVDAYREILYALQGGVWPLLYEYLRFTQELKSRLSYAYSSVNMQPLPLLYEYLRFTQELKEDWLYLFY